MKLTIAQFTADLERAGQQRVVVDLAKAFQKTGHRALVCTTMGRGELQQELTVKGIPYNFFGLRKNYDLRALGPIIHYLKHKKADVAITHGFYGSFVPRLASIIARVPVYLHVEHNVSDDKRTYHILINRLLTIFSDRIICISDNARCSLLEIEKPNSDKVITILNGIDTERFRLLEKSESSRFRSNGTKRVGLVGRFSEQKGHTYFVEAAAQVVRLFKDVEFIFVGEGPLRPVIEEKVKSYGLTDHCQFLGVRSDVGELLQTFDVFVLPSLWEGLPISLLEAQFFGIASVVTDVGGNSEVIKNGHNGLLVPARDPDALAKAIVTVLNDKGLAKELGVRGKEVFSRKYSANKMAKTYLDLIQTILCSHAKGRSSNE